MTPTKDQIRTVILDEAAKLMDVGFITRVEPVVERALASIPSQQVDEGLREKLIEIEHANARIASKAGQAKVALDPDAGAVRTDTAAECLSCIAENVKVVREALNVALLATTQPGPQTAAEVYAGLETVDPETDPRFTRRDQPPQQQVGDGR